MDALGDAFDIKEFHRVILGNGSMPLSVLEEVVQDYIDEALGSNALVWHNNVTFLNVVNPMFNVVEASCQPRYSFGIQPLYSFLMTRT
jgi:hypothetical protein